ncbi:ubiquitinyl hydrolase 1 [Madurella fahalii]|uniref:ubiquitinyl hydrolase 1 n=1 Tax=Madurella fahalii TaxID=1157608 RepID=A0ABQ0GJW7_9PEZI
MNESSVGPERIAVEAGSLMYSINHVFLPPKTPGEDDMNLDHERDLVRFFLCSIMEFSKECSTTESALLGRATQMLQRLLTTQPGSGFRDKGTVMAKVIRELNCGKCALFHIRAQNAGLLLTAREDDTLIEAFELLAPNTNVMSCRGRLIREFPDCAAVISHTVLHDSNFLDEFLNVLCRLELEKSSVARPRVMKSGVAHGEERETVSPILVTDMLMATLSGVGRGVEPQRISKRSWEQVNWDNSLLPFHRSPTWLLVRAALRLMLDRQPSQEGHRSLYKAVTTFHHSWLLNQAILAHLDSDLRFAMSAKLVRRLVKLNPQQELAWLRKARKIIAKNYTALELRWQRVQAEIVPNQVCHLGQLRFQPDSNLRLKRLSQHLAWIQSRCLYSQGTAGSGDKTKFTRFPASELPDLSSSGTLEAFVLLDFETWMESNLATWVARRLQQMRVNFRPETEIVADLQKLQALEQHYHQRAGALYNGNPEALSLMCLNVMELWVTMDQLAREYIPLLRDYDPGFPANFLYPLILPTQGQMLRLQQVELYLSARRERARNGYPLIYSAFGKEPSFAVRYFNSSACHRSLLQEIRAIAERTQAEKVDEYHTLRNRYEELLKDQASSVHDQTWDDQAYDMKCTRICNACALKDELASMKIDIFEWPLPNNDNQAKAIVFEINVPEAVVVWRDMTTDLLLYRFGDKHIPDRVDRLWYASHQFGVNDKFKKFKSRTSRVQLASRIKPVKASHYRAKHISTVTDKDVWVQQSSTSYDYYEGTAMIHSSSVVFCDPGIPAKYSHANHQRVAQLQAWTESTGHTSNAVIAAQSDCPLTMSFDEFRSFGHLRSGVSLQWANVLCQLTIPSLDWNKESTYFLVLQACLEAGPPSANGSVARRAHSDLLYAGFGNCMVEALTNALGRFGENWQNDIAVSILASLTTRVLHLSPCSSLALTESLLKLLARVRGVTILWARQLLDKVANSSVSASVRDELRQKVLMAALISISTFDIEPAHMEAVLRSPTHLSSFVETAILAQTHMPTNRNLPSPVLVLLHHRWRRIMHAASQFVAGEVVAQRNAGFHDAIRRFWADYSSEAVWSVQPGQNEHILEASIARKKSDPINITFNLLEARLLVDGHPLSRLPPEYEAHPAYTKLFGSRILEVMPSKCEGMRFSACRDQHGWVVHFAMVDSKLVIQAVRDGVATEICEFIPPSELIGDVPTSFANNYFHWLHLGTRVIEFRPANEPWATSATNWAVTKENGRNVLRRDECYLIDPHSPTAITLSNMLKPIESKENVDIIFHRANRIVVLDLPRYTLSFMLIEGESNMRSKNYSGMCIDEYQRLDTLVGLQNKLVLRQEGVSEPLTPQKIVLVPRGRLLTSKTSDHVSVTVHVSDTISVRHDTFTVNSKLGCITGSGSPRSKLYLCLLHALTSHCLPDLLTQRTGTEEALRILDSASVQSFQRLDEESHDLLREILQLSPCRRFYPSHLEGMEQIRWSDSLPVLSQQDGFLSAAESILAHAQDCELLYQTSRDSGRSFAIEPIDRSSSLLVERAKIRNSIFCVSGFGAEEHTSGHDAVYLGRHRTQNRSGREKRTRTKSIANCVATGCQKLVDRPSSRLGGAILKTTGCEFPGYPHVDVTFTLKHLQPPSTSLEGLWCGLHRTLVKEPNRYKILFFLSALMYAQDGNWDLVQTLMAISNVRAKFRDTITPPMDLRYNLKYTKQSLGGIVRTIVDRDLYRFERCPEKDLPAVRGETRKEAQSRRRRIWKSRSNGLVAAFVSKLESQWSRGWTVTTPTDEAYQYYMDVNSIMCRVRDAVGLAQSSAHFSDYLDLLTEELDRMSFISSNESQDGPSQDCPSLHSERQPDSSRPGFVQHSALFSRPAPSARRPQLEDFTHLCQLATQRSEDNHLFSRLLDHLSQLSGQQPYQAAYVKELRNSSRSASIPRSQLAKGHVNLRSVFDGYLIRCRCEAEQIRKSIDEALRGRCIAEDICHASGLYPRISPVFLLQHLSRAFWGNLPTDWKVCLVNYGLSLVYLLRAERLANASRRPKRRTDFLKELLNPGSHECSNEGDPLDYPENLILELEQGILIRPIQQRIAAVMRDPPGGESCEMQLNMGEGKSSVIVPVVSAALANGHRIVRVVVAKPQSSQMMHTLVGALGGLINRRIFHLPISRAVRLSDDGVQAVQRMLDTCKKEGGILLVHPEHLLSFKLMALESIWTEGATANSVGKKILDTYRQFEADSRDIVDESDENFSVKFELMYTMGRQQPVDMSPDRWALIQDLMDVVVDVARELVNGPASSTRDGLLLVEDEAGGRFPTIRVLEESAGVRLVTTVAENVCRTGLRGFPIQHQSKKMRRVALQYMLNPNVGPEHIAAAENTSSGFFNNEMTKNALLLLRGLLASGILHFALGQKRFRVNYGLAPDRRPPTKLSVPYRAKDSPAPRSEFSHPDVVIVLTCLSYYYQGLSDDELRMSLETLSKSDQAEQEYTRWASASPRLPSSLRQFPSVNLKDSALCTQQIFPALRFAKPAVDFYLGNIVFPKEMREFPLKLSASGWDLARPKPHPLTGFSGTTDSKYALPLSIETLDLPEQRHTNSAVLACLLRNENTVLELGGDCSPHPSALTVDMLLSATTSSPPMRVILDVGAQIIELSNLQVAKRWLDLVPHDEADAVIFFNDHDELSVLTRNGMVDSFLTSPFAAQTDHCLAFLDQAHTRGTDLRLPDDYRAAVTLGPGVTKDTLVQACMRMRKLGNGQSVTFCVSPEMQRRIRRSANLDATQPLTVSDILLCAITETWDDARRSVPLWATQGIRHQRQEVVWGRLGETGNLSVQDVRDYLENEAQTLEQRYRSRSGINGARDPESLTSKLDAAMQLEGRQSQVAQIKQKCIDFGLGNLDSTANLQEEQERELAPEAEQERQVQRPPPKTPASHELHDDVVKFATSGVMTRNSAAFLPAFETLADSSASAHFPASGFPSELLVTADFARTVEAEGQPTASYSDAYQRPVQWILTQAVDRCEARYGMHMVVVSSWEADRLKARLETLAPAPAPRRSASVRGPRGRVFLRAYLPRSSLSFRTLEDLMTYTIPHPPNSPSAPPPPPPPPELLLQLNLFAGQLYLRSYADYQRACRYLGLSYAENDNDNDDDDDDDGGGSGLAADGFVGRKRYAECEFERSPVAFLTGLYKRIRRDCTSIERTHLGRMLGGEILRGSDFEGADGGGG